MHKLTISDRQFDHIIAGLRLLEIDLEDGALATEQVGPLFEPLLAIATEHGDLMTPEEIDSFIQEINPMTTPICNFWVDITVHYSSPSGDNATHTFTRRDFDLDAVVSHCRHKLPAEYQLFNLSVSKVVIAPHDGSVAVEVQ
jgi:hypothetical protein